MPSRLRIALFLTLALLTIGLVACGGDDAASEDPNALLEETFSGEKQVDSGNIDLKLVLNAQGGELEGPVNVRLSGPFQTEGEGKLPQFDFDLSFEGAGQSFAAGAISTGDAGFVTFQGTDYAVSDEIFQQFKQGFEQAQTEGEGDKGPSLADFGIDPRNWLTDAKNEGEAKVGDDDAIKITGGVDVEKLLDDIDKALPKIREQTGGAGDIPEKLSPEERKAVTDAVQDVSVEIYTGKDDKILRRILLNMTITPPADAEGVDVESADITFDLSITGVNSDQEINAPEDAKPLDELLGQLGGLGLGGLGGGGADPGADPGASGGASSEALEEYSNCIREAGSDAQKAQECAELLAP